MIRAPELGDEGRLLGREGEDGVARAQKAREGGGQLQALAHGVDVARGQEHVAGEHDLGHKAPRALLLLEQLIAQGKARAQKLRAHEARRALRHGLLLAGDHLQHVPAHGRGHANAAGCLARGVNR